MNIHNLSKAFGKHTVLTNLSLSLKEGQIYALMGPSGCGKTTFLHILMGLQKPDCGDLSAFQGKKFSAVFQENRLCDFLTAEENIRIILSDPKNRNIKEVLSEILPTSSLDQPVSTFSGGMKRRAAIARAMLAESDLLIMDEPFSGLDEHTKEQVMHFILKYRNYRTLLFSTHTEEDVTAMNAIRIDLGEKILQKISFTE